MINTAWYCQKNGHTAPQSRRQNMKKEKRKEKKDPHTFGHKEAKVIQQRRVFSKSGAQMAEHSVFLKNESRHRS